MKTANYSHIMFSIYIFLFWIPNSHTTPGDSVVWMWQTNWQLGHVMNGWGSLGCSILFRTMKSLEHYMTVLSYLHPLQMGSEIHCHKSFYNLWIYAGKVIKWHENFNSVISNRIESKDLTLCTSRRHFCEQRWPVFFFPLDFSSRSYSFIHITDLNSKPWHCSACMD